MFTAFEMAKISTPFGVEQKELFTVISTIDRNPKMQQTPDLSIQALRRPSLRSTSKINSLEGYLDSAQELLVLATHSNRENSMGIFTARKVSVDSQFDKQNE